MSSSVLTSEHCQNEEVNSLYFEIRSSGNFGRYLVAKEDIEEKTLVLSEIPVAFGPTDDKNLETNIVSIYCVSCCKLLYPLPAHGSCVREEKDSDSTYAEIICYCSDCGFPVCDKHCEKSPIHSENECKFFSSIYQHKVYPPPHKWLMYKSIILLRLLLLIKNDPESVWENFLEKLEHHTTCRESKENCVRADEIVLENLYYFTEGLTTKRRSVSKKNGRKYKLPFLDDESTLRRIIGTLNVNSFCANNNITNRIARCMFKNASLFAHSCAPNCCWTVEVSLMDQPEPGRHSKSKKQQKGKNGVRKSSLHDSHKIIPEIQIYTAVSVKKGEMLTIPYSTRHIFCGTLKRQLCMETVGHFECKCYRCMDATELGTFMSSVRCFKCEKGFLVSSEPSEQESQWVCVPIKDGDAACGCKCSVGKVVYFVTNIQDQVDKVKSRDLEWKDEQEKLQLLFNKYRGQELHENHYVLLEISNDIVELLAAKLLSNGDDVDNDNAGVEELLDKFEKEMLLERFLFHVKYLLKIADVILPGFNNYQEQLRYYLELGETLKLKTQSS